jgi:hypothetical protein
MRRLLARTASQRNPRRYRNKAILHCTFFLRKEEKKIPHEHDNPWISIYVYTRPVMSASIIHVFNVYNYNGRERRDEEALITLFFLFASFVICCSLFAYAMNEVLMKLVNGWDVLRCLREYIIYI